MRFFKFLQIIGFVGLMLFTLSVENLETAQLITYGAAVGITAGLGVIGEQIIRALRGQR